MDNTGYVRLTIWILMDNQLDKKLDTKGYNRIHIRICLGYVNGEIEGYQWISKKDILLYPKHILLYPKYVTFSNLELIRMYGYDRLR